MASLDLSGTTILVVEDDNVLRKRIVARLEALGAEVAGADALAAAREALAARNFDFLFLDVNLPDGLGTDLLREKMFPSTTGVVVITAHGGVSSAVEAMRMGAADYLVKPFDISALGVAVDRVQAARRLARVKEWEFEGTAGDGLFFGKTLGPLEAKLQRILEADRRMEKELPPVLIEGETGTGKTTLARWLHQHGPRAGQPLVEVNCSALPEALAESELFGHERGAFTDAKATRLGLFEAASGGTLFLDELPSLSLPLQAKILKAIEDRVIRRVGGTKPIAVDARVVAATNRSLKELVKQGSFREDLFHRLDLYRLVVPPLRERGEDIIPLAERLLAQICRRHRLPAKNISPTGQRRLLAYHWPGNVRELAHELERAVVFEDGNELGLPQLGPGSDEAATDLKTGSDWLNLNYDFKDFSLEAAIDRLIEIALQRTNGNASAAGRMLGVPRDYIRYRLHGPRTKQDAPDSGK